MELQTIGRESQALMPFHSLLLPVLKPFLVGAGLDEELHLHLLELTRPENEISGRNLVSEGLADLCDAERNSLACGLLDIQEVHVRALRRFGTQVDRRRAVLNRAHECLEHEVELARRAEGSLHSAGGALRIGRAGCSLDRLIVGPKALFAVAAVNEGIDESADVSARFPHPRVHQDRGVEALDVIALANHCTPPPVLEVALELDAEWAVVPYGASAAVDLG